jgi:hypothetical protein
MRFTLTTIGAVAAAGWTLASVASGGGLDVLLLPGSGVVTTGSFDDDTKSVVSMNERVFSGDFGGADPGQPNFSDEPGFRSLKGNFMGEQWGFNLLDAAFVWNGSNFGTQSPFTITFDFGPSPDIVTPGTPGQFVPGFSLPVPDEGFDDHLNITLNGPMDASADGIYLVKLDLFTTGFGRSAPIWFVLNRGLSEAEHDTAIEYVRSEIVPAPGALALGLLGLAGRRRRSV